MTDGAYPPNVNGIEATATTAPPPDAVPAVSSTSPPGTYLTVAELERLQDELTMGDSWRAMQATDDNREQGMRAFWNVAKRIGVVDADCTLDGFLDRVRQDDFTKVVGGAGRESKETS